MRDQRIFNALQVLNPMELIVENESHLHGFSRGEDSHFKVLIVSEAFEGMSRIERHQKVNALLEEELKGGGLKSPSQIQALHALTLRTLTPSEWEKADPRAFQSPKCAHSKS